MGNLNGRFAIVGVGINERSKNSGKTPLRMAVEAARIAIADAGLEAKDIDAFMSYKEMDSCGAHQVATALGVRPSYVKDIYGGGSSTEVLIADACGLIEFGLAKTVLIYRSMNGRSGTRMGGSAMTWTPEELMSGFSGGAFIMPYGMGSPSQWFGIFATRHMHLTGLKREHLGHVCCSFYENAQRNPKAMLYGKPLTMEEYMNTPFISTPFTKHDYCLETDEANCIIVTSAERAKDCKSKPIYIMGIVAREGHPNAHYWADVDKVAADWAAPKVFERAGVERSDIDVAAIYDCYSWVVLRQLEAFGFAPRGEVGDWVAEGNLRMTGKLPCNTAGGMLSEGYTHGMNNAIELVRQLRHEYKGTDRQVKDCKIGLDTGWAGPDLESAMILRN